MLGNLKNYALIGLGFVAMLFFGLYNKEKTARQTEKIKGLNRARKIEKKANKAVMDGLNNEQKAKDNINLNDDDKLI